MTTSEAKAFCDRWLDAWTGNRPDRLLEFYAPDAFYRDPGRPGGLRGADALRAYFSRLLAANPEWTWRAEEVIPTERGFTLKWRAVIPAGGKNIEETGLDIVEMEDGRISRNEVYFDRSALLAAR